MLYRTDIERLALILDVEMTEFNEWFLYYTHAVLSKKRPYMSDRPDVRVVALSQHPKIIHAYDLCWIQYSMDHVYPQEPDWTWTIELRSFSSDEKAERFLTPVWDKEKNRSGGARVNIFPLIPEGIEVTFKCFDYVLMDFLKDLRAAILSQWPEQAAPLSPSTKRERGVPLAIRMEVEREAQMMKRLRETQPPTTDAVEQKSVDDLSRPEKPLDKLVRLSEEERVSSERRDRRIRVLARRGNKVRIEDIADEEGRGIRTINYDIAWLKEKGFLE